jgi:hypothetical protein
MARVDSRFGMPTHVALGAALLGASLLGPALPAHAGTARAAVDTRLALGYDPPQISADDSHLTWRFTVSNTGDAPADKVLLISRLTPPLPGVTASGECAVTSDEAITCDYGLLAAGGTRSGSVAADLPHGLSGDVYISGRVTWQRPAGG